ncbi:MAG: hypothetical protein AAGG53_06370 [Cyanobacteria bacterium P01_H01_bin.152]
MFNIDEFIIAVFLTVDVRLKALVTLYPPRGRGFTPTLSDSEVLTLEIVGEVLGHHSDRGIWCYFRHHWQSWFPALQERTPVHP